MWPVILLCICLLLTVALIVLIIKVILLRRAFREIGTQVKDHLDGTNSSAFQLSTSDSDARKLANELNSELQQLHAERISLKDGDKRMKANVTAISHDLRTPLTAINSYVDLLDGEKDENKRKEYLERIKDRTSELKDMTADLFKYSVSADTQYDSQLSVEDIDLKQIIETSLISFYNEFSSKGITPQTDFPAGKVIINCNRKTLMRIFDNVFSNAAKYAASLSVRLTEEGVVTVTNDAPELTSVQVSKMFDKYYTVSDGSGSTGLGLSIAKELVGQLGGDIKARLNEGRLTLELDLRRN